MPLHGEAGFFFNNPHGGWEYPALRIVALIVQTLLGDGICALRAPRIDVTAVELSRAHLS